MRKSTGHRKKTKYKDPPGLAVEVRNNNIELALKRFKKKVKDSNLMVELRDRKYYEKPSAQRRKERGLSKARQKYRTQKEK
tara:strand:- start:39 stop:281 length:243 start_codon:yes stop_codon:yes gene_type:complete